jgi:hypothetical protein
MLLAAGHLFRPVATVKLFVVQQREAALLFDGGVVPALIVLRAGRLVWK